MVPNRLLGGPYRLPKHACKGGTVVAGQRTHFDPIAGDYVRKCRICKHRFDATVVPLDETVQAGLGVRLFKVRWLSDSEAVAE